MTRCHRRRGHASQCSVVGTHCVRRPDHPSIRSKGAWDAPIAVGRCTAVHKPAFPFHGVNLCLPLISSREIFVSVRNYGQEQPKQTELVGENQHSHNIQHERCENKQCYARVLAHELESAHRTPRRAVGGGVMSSLLRCLGTVRDQDHGSDFANLIQSNQFPVQALLHRGRLATTIRRRPLSFSPRSKIYWYQNGDSLAALFH
jgi:hypothetical protein